MSRFLYLFILIALSASLRHAAAAVDNETADTPASGAPASGKAKSINVDMQMLYGQYNTMLSTINLSHEGESAVSLLSSSFKRSNDFGYSDTTFGNTSFNENRIGYTGNIDLSETLRLLPEAEINNESRGMYDNTVYSREEKDKIKVSIKSVKKFSSRPFEMYGVAGWTNFTHRLAALDPAEMERSRLYQGWGELGGDYVWSASNRIRGLVRTCYNNYTGDAPYDLYATGELIDDFNLTKYVGMSLGFDFDVNRDDNQRPVVLLQQVLIPVIGVTLKGFEFLTASFLYRCYLASFRPEELYLEQKYINPAYNLPPGLVHHGDMRLRVSLNSSMDLNLNVVAENNRHFYNYRPVYGNVLAADTIEATFVRSRLEANIAAWERLIEIMLGYEYAWFDAGRHITYRPEHAFNTSLQLNAKKYKVDYSNRITGRVYVRPESDYRLGTAVVGSLGVQLLLLENFYAYFRADNLYNSRYHLRDGYPEPGVTVLAGLRILI